MTSIYILWHLGLGDAIICNGLVRFYADRFDKVMIPAYEHNFDSVAFMFRDQKNIKVVPVANDIEAIKFSDESKDPLQLGYYSTKGFDKDKFDEEFYRQANVPFEYRWSRYKILTHQAGAKGAKAEFVHDDNRRGFVIDKSKVGPNWVSPIQYDIMFNNAYLIQAAPKVHCINSSFLCFIDSMEDIPGQELFLHKYARATIHPKLKRNWKILE